MKRNAQCDWFQIRRSRKPLSNIQSVRWIQWRTHQCFDLYQENRLDGFIHGRQNLYQESGFAWQTGAGFILHAANAMKVAPEKTIVIEDSPSGARAGLAAGNESIRITAVSHNAPEVYDKNLKPG